MVGEVFQITEGETTASGGDQPYYVPLQRSSGQELGELVPRAVLGVPGVL